MKKPEKIFLASANPHKIKELHQILRPLSIELMSTIDIESREDVAEDQPTLEGNALKKARFWREKTGHSVIADDTGLEVQALGGAPGVYSARYAGENASYDDNVRKLLHELKGRGDRRASFRTVIAYIDNGEHLFEGRCDGFITTEASGSNGFGYDPVFMPVDYDQTFAELDSEKKNSISHRGRALEKFKAFLSGQNPHSNPHTPGVNL